MNTKSSKKTDQVCSYCKKSFKSERTLIAHICRLKSRDRTRNDVDSQLAFYAYGRFYMLSQGNVIKTWDQFIDSSYYAGFIRFANYVKSYRVVNPHMFIDWIIKNGCKLDDWAKDSTYVRYLLQLLVNETATSAVERSLLAMQTWADENNVTLGQYFYHASANRMVKDITAGVVSPWILYGTESGREALAQLNEEQLNYVMKYIDPSIWQEKIANSEELSLVKFVAQEAGFK